MRIYISGKVTGTTDYLTRFGNAEARLSQEGYTVINPARVLDELPKDTTWRGYMLVALAMLLQADAVYMLSGWETSKGADIERLLAEYMGKEIMWEE